MALTAAQIEARRGKLTASRVGVLMKGDAAGILQLYRELIGEAEPEDLSRVWPVQLGSATEQLNLDWYEAKTGQRVTRRGEVVCNTDWSAATLDGWIEDLRSPIECKHVGGREPMEVVVERYQPQMHWQMICTGSQECALSVIMGASEPIVEFVLRDNEYARELWVRGFQFMEFVRTRKPPVALDPVAAPVPRGRVYDMSTSNLWVSQATDWLANYKAAEVAKDAEKALKEIVPADAVKCTGAGVQITVNRAGAKSLREFTA